MTDSFKRHLLGPTTIFFLLFFGELGVRYLGFPVSVAIPFAVLALTVFRWSGLRASLVSALMIALYPFLFHYEDYGFDRAFLLAVSAFLIAAPSGVLKRALREEAIETERQKLLVEVEHQRAEDNQAKADAYDTLNGNIDTLKKLARRISDLTNGWELLNDRARMDILEEVQGGLVNLAQKVVGWHEIAQEKKGLFKEENDEA